MRAMLSTTRITNLAPLVIDKLPYDPVLEISSIGSGKKLSNVAHFATIFLPHTSRTGHWIAIGRHSTCSALSVLDSRTQAILPSTVIETCGRQPTQARCWIDSAIARNADRGANPSPAVFDTAKRFICEPGSGRSGIRRKMLSLRAISRLRWTGSSRSSGLRQ